ncbi:similar to Saccharomyces cerevisiae YHL034C SBP1 Putative RNA binding protein [Maudiozyma saulgeensis]|uniref:Similar to Saccharomyces cerevisiae YHL034C SBP1 Putative RNA binding protein n=1 Tax=Maudiozyma saulgeensis TaxID=1789683 RepID=A0A1X7RBU8_9SACH|nr:similar to Saccharomyces cerevisiae YHL034C SBP1 Putative RNA binding protein [Kazachstania saulgeensis]
MELEMPPKEIILKDTTNIKVTSTTKDNKRGLLESERSSVYVGNIPMECTKKDLQLFLKDEKDVLKILLRTTKVKVAGKTKVIKFAFVSFKVNVNVDELNSKYSNNNFFGIKQLYFEKVETKKPTSQKIENIDQRIVKPSTASILKPDVRNTSTKVKENSLETEVDNRRGNSNNTLTKYSDEKKPRNNKLESKYPLGTTSKNKTPPPHSKKSAKTIFIKNIPYDITKKELAEFLNVNGKSVSLPKGRLQDLTTGRILTSHKTNRGYSFVTFENLSPEETIQQKIDSLQGIVLKNRKLTIEFAIDKEEPNDNTVPTSIISVTKM